MPVLLTISLILITIVLMAGAAWLCRPAISEKAVLNDLDSIELMFWGWSGHYTYDGDGKPIGGVFHQSLTTMEYRREDDRVEVITVYRFYYKGSFTIRYENGLAMSVVKSLTPLVEAMPKEPRLTVMLLTEVHEILRVAEPQKKE